MLHSFDTLAANKKLREVGMPMAQAETVTDVTAMATRNLVTRDYLNLRR